MYIKLTAIKYQNANIVILNNGTKRVWFFFLILPFLNFSNSGNTAMYYRIILYIIQLYNDKWIGILLKNPLFGKINEKEKTRHIFLHLMIHSP